MKHKHADIIKAWADGAEIEFRHEGDNWQTAYYPAWVAHCEYRVKPAAPAKVYPTTLLTGAELIAEYRSNHLGPVLDKVANAAIRHAIDADQVVPMAEVQKAAEKMRQHFAARELAIARAVDAAYCTLVPTKQRNSDNYLCSIIVSVK